MSGHSKWHKIQHKKGKADKVRSSMFTKLLKAITVAAGQGGGDTDMNFSLRLAVEKAKAGNVPKENIERAIKKGTGELVDGERIEEITYEGFGPGGVAFIVECLTDNKNRTVSEVKYAFSKGGGSMGSAGSVQWQFDRLGVVRINNEDFKKQAEDFELNLIESGADDIIDSEYGIEIRCGVENLRKVLEVIKKFEIEPESSGLEWIAKEEIELDEDMSNKVENLYDMFMELDDVNEVYTNEK